MGLGFRLPVQGTNFQARDSGFEGVGVFSPQMLLTRKYPGFRSRVRGLLHVKE